MRYNPDCHVQLDPLSEPPPPRHLDVLSTIPGMDVDDGDQMIYTPPSLQTLQEMARHTRRRFASSRQNLNGEMFASISEIFRRLIRWLASQSLSENTYIYCSPIVKGFCLHAKKWGKSGIHKQRCSTLSKWPRYSVYVCRFRQRHRMEQRCI